jgi:hypothetical protein
MLALSLVQRDPLEEELEAQRAWYRSSWEQVAALLQGSPTPLLRYGA